ncbi:hypothetical protein BS78_06G028600 [Paspalum vaginatum]|nr:hypothetical protein BS78_06G028600 [Paspalum vaginatum]
MGSPGNGTRTASTSSIAGTSSSIKHTRRRGPTSKVWLDVEEVTEIQGGNEFNADGSLVHWEYSPSIARIELCRLIARLDLPLCFGESDAFQEYITNAHNPKFAKSSRQTTVRDLIQLFNDRMEQLVDVLKSGVSSIALTSDIWSSKAKEDYISVTYRVAHTGHNISERVEMVANDYGIADKIFAIVLDNASSNKTAMDVLKPLSGYIGHLLPKPGRNEEVLSAIFLHQRCACHIINLIMKSCLKHLQPYLEDFRTAITFFNSSNQCIASYKQYCLSVGVCPRKFRVDMDVRWNSTYLMLKHLVPYQSTFSVWIQTNHPRKEDGSILLTPNHWAIAEKLLSFLELFYISTVALSGVYYPTSLLMLHHILKIARHLTKMRGFHKVLQKLQVLLGIDYSKFPSDIRNKLTKMYQVYKKKFGAACLTAPTLPGGCFGKGTEAWDDIYGDDDLGIPLGGGAGTSGSSYVLSGSSFALSELSSYLDSDTKVKFGSDFNILNWWQRHNQTYPILSILAKDVMTVPRGGSSVGARDPPLTVPISTISLESTFSLASSVLEKRRRRLTIDMVEVLSCIKDWELADQHKQHTVEKETKDLETAFEAMYLDDEREVSLRSKRKEQEGGLGADEAAGSRGKRT